MVRTGLRPYAGMKALITKGSCFLKSQIDKLMLLFPPRERKIFLFSLSVKGKGPPCYLNSHLLGLETCGGICEH